MSAPLLKASGVTSGFGDYQVLWGVDLEVAPGEIAAILGPNGSGKSTFMAALSGVHPSWDGKVVLEGREVQHLPAHKRVALGLSHVLERRRLFGYLSVRDNLLLGATLRHARKHRAESEEWAYSLFPILRERARQLAYKLSGGEQQMLAIARGLMTRPKLLLLDEPLLGLSPAQVDLVVGVIRTLREQGVTVLFVEQNVRLALDIADRCLLMRGGQAVLDAPSVDLEEDDVMSVYVGGDPAESVRRRKEGTTHV